MGCEWFIEGHQTHGKHPQLHDQCGCHSSCSHGNLFVCDCVFTLFAELKRFACSKSLVWLPNSITSTYLVYMQLEMSGEKVLVQAPTAAAETKSLPSSAAGAVSEFNDNEEGHRLTVEMFRACADPGV